MIRSLILIGAFGLALIGAGHGIMPIAYLLVVGSYEAWGPGIATGWAGILGVLAYQAYGKDRLPNAVLSCAQCTLYLSWILFASVIDHSYTSTFLERAIGMMIWSLPFQIAFAFIAVLPLVRARKK